MLNLQEIEQAKDEQDLCDILTSKLDGSDYGLGAVEEAQNTASKGNEAIVKLILILKDKEFITNSDIVTIFNHIY